MPSILARFKNRAGSTSTNTPEPTPPPSPLATPIHSPTPHFHESTTHIPIDLRIHHDLASLLPPSPEPGLPPPLRRHSLSHQRLLADSREPLAQLPPTDTMDDPDLTQATITKANLSAGLSVRPSLPNMARISGEWSTFGRTHPAESGAYQHHEGYIHSSAWNDYLTPEAASRSRSGGARSGGSSSGNGNGHSGPSRSSSSRSAPRESQRSKRSSHRSSLKENESNVSRAGSQRTSAGGSYRLNSAPSTPPVSVHLPSPSSAHGSNSMVRYYFLNPSNVFGPPPQGSGTSPSWPSMPLHSPASFSTISAASGSPGVQSLGATFPGTILSPIPAHINPPDVRPRTPSQTYPFRSPPPPKDIIASRFHTTPLSTTPPSRASSFDFRPPTPRVQDMFQGIGVATPEDGQSSATVADNETGVAEAKQVLLLLARGNREAPAAERSPHLVATATSSSASSCPPHHHTPYSALPSSSLPPPSSVQASSVPNAAGRDRLRTIHSHATRTTSQLGHNPDNNAPQLLPQTTTNTTPTTTMMSEQQPSVVSVPFTTPTPVSPPPASPPAPSALAARETPLKARSPLSPRTRAARHAFPRTVTPSSSSSATVPEDSEAGPSTPPYGPPRAHAHRHIPSSPTPVTRKSALRPASMTRAATLPSPPGSPEATSTPVNGKRKAEDDSPPDPKGSLRATRFAEADSRGHLISDASTPSYYRKRPRVSGPPPSTPSRSSTPIIVAPDQPGTPRPPSRTVSNRASLLSTRSAKSARSQPAPPPPPMPDSPTRQSVGKRASVSQMSQASAIPMSAIVAPHAPSVTVGRQYHMRDPRRPQIRETGWVPRPRSAAPEEPGSPVHAWLFYVGFLVFPIWWVASVLGVPTTRTLGESDSEKGVMVDDPQIEHDARRWRFRCRIMSAVSLFTYIPFIVLVSIFATR